MDEMEKWQQFARNRQRELEEEKAELIYKYGTSDRKRIEEIEKEKRKDTEGSCFVIILLFIIIPFIFMLIAWILGLDGGLRDMPWSPRHT